MFGGISFADVFGFWFLVFGFWFLVFGISCSRAFGSVVGFWSLVFGTSCLALPYCFYEKIV